MRPQKTRSNQRLYRKRDIQTLLHIKRLLYEEKFTIAGANKRLRQLLKGSDEGRNDRVVEVIRKVRKDVQELLALVNDDR